MNLSTKQKQTQRQKKNRLVIAKGESWGRMMNWEFGVSRCKRLHLERITNKILLYNTGNRIQSPGIDYDGK